MMKHKEWLLDELPSLRRAGILDEDAAERVRQHYSGDTGGSESKKNRMLMVFAVLGSLLIGSGIILLLAYNWPQLSRLHRTIIAFLPLAVAQSLGVWASGQSVGAARREGVAILLTAAVGTSLALVAQTYHIAGGFDRFLFTWVLLSLPISYLLNARAPAVACIIGTVVWAGFMRAHGDPFLLWSWLLLAASVPYAAITLEPGASRRFDPDPLLWWFIAPAAAVLYGITGSYSALPELSLPGFASLFGLYYLSERRFFAHLTNTRHRPLYILGVLGLLATGFFATSSNWWQYAFERPPDQFLVSELVYWLLPAALLLILLIRSYPKKNLSSFMLALLPMVLWTALFIAMGVSGPAGELIPFLMMNAYVIGVGITAAVNGIQTERSGMISAGMAIAVLVILMRFFEWDMSLLARAVAFIVLGSAFIALNIFVIRRKREEADK